MSSNSHLHKYNMQAKSAYTATSSRLNTNYKTTGTFGTKTNTDRELKNASHT